MTASLGIVHRALKPQNLFLAESATGSIGNLPDLDASKLSAYTGTLTQGRVIGTPSSMSPQQVKGKTSTVQQIDIASQLSPYGGLTGRARICQRPPFYVYGTPACPSVVADLKPAIYTILAIGMVQYP